MQTNDYQKPLKKKKKKKKKEFNGILKIVIIIIKNIEINQNSTLNNLEGVDTLLYKPNLGLCRSSS